MVACRDHLRDIARVHGFKKKLVAFLPVPPGPYANEFTSATALFRLLDWLDDRGTLTVRQVVEELECSERQARDYLAFLEQRGLVRRERRGRTDEYHRDRREAKRADAIALTETTGTEFAVAVLGALRGTAFHEAAIEHIKRLRRDLAGRQGPRAARLRSAFYAVRGSAPMNPQHAEHAEVILDALMHGNALDATYELVSTGEVKEYRLLPLGIVVHHHDGLHLLARRADNRQIRTFDVEGFRRIERRRGRTTPPPEFRMDAYFADAFGRYTDFPVEDVVLRISGAAARQVRRRAFHRSQRIASDDGTTVVVGFKVGVCPEFTAWVLGLAPDVEVLAPPSLRADVERRHATGARRNRASRQRPGNARPGSK